MKAGIVRRKERRQGTIDWGPRNLEESCPPGNDSTYVAYWPEGVDCNNHSAWTTIVVLENIEHTL